MCQKKDKCSIFSLVIYNNTMNYLTVVHLKTRCVYKSFISNIRGAYDKFLDFFSCGHFY